MDKLRAKKKQSLSERRKTRRYGSVHFCVVVVKLIVNTEE